MSTPQGESWVAELREIARGAASSGVETLRGARPGLLDATSANAVSSLALAAFVTGAALFRTQVASSGPLSEPGIDLIASALRTLAVAFCVRAVVALARSLRTFWADRHAARAALVLADQGLLLQVAGQEQWAARSEVLDVTFEEPLPSRTLAPRPPAVLLVLEPRAGQPRVIAVPPYFAPSAEITAARLKRWLTQAGPARASSRSSAAVLGDPGQRYDRAAHGQLTEGDAVIPEGHCYLLRAPFTSLLGIVFALDVLRTAGGLRAQIVQPVLAASVLCVVLIAGWLLWMRRRRATRLGLGMLLTPEELLVRGRGGVVAVPWAQLKEVEVGLRPRWSPFVGPYATRLLTLITQEQQQMIFDQSFLGAPVSVIAVLCKSYREALAREP